MSKKLTSDKDFITFLMMVVIVLLPVILTIHTIKVPVNSVFQSDTTAVSAPMVTTDNPIPEKKHHPNASPLGYTWSLSLFIIPIITIWIWLRFSFKDKIIEKTFWLTIGILTPIGFLLDLVFGNLFFIFPNKDAYLGIYLPGYNFELNAWTLSLPIEEFIFYATGFMAILSLHMWCDEHWFGAYNKLRSSAEHEVEIRKLKGIMRNLHIPSLIFGAILIVAAVLYKKYGNHEHNSGFPGYFTFLVLIAIVPAIAFFHTAKVLINWRAFSFTFFFVLLISLIWEATFANPYGWWWYNHEQMLGSFIEPWSTLPVEASLLWMAVTFTTVVVYKTIRIWLLSGKTFRTFFWG